MKPTWTSDCGTVQLYLGDCLEVLPTLGQVDAVVTDPPYGIGFKYSSGKEKTQNAADYARDIVPLIKQAESLLLDGGFLAVWQAHKNLRHAWNWFGDDCVVYAACKNFCQLLPMPIQLNGFDPVVMRYNGKPRKASNPSRSLNWSMANTANMKARGIERGHPCPRPIEHANEIISNFVCDDATILDPFMGSGTTGVACVNLNRKFIGIEIDAGYFEIAKKRIITDLKAARGKK